jgi:hypothetical protein
MSSEHLVSQSAALRTATTDTGARAPKGAEPGAAHGAAVGTAVVQRHHLNVDVLVAAVDVFVLDAEVREVELAVEKRQAMVIGPTRDLALIAIVVPIVVVTVVIMFMEPGLILALELVVQDNALDMCVAFLEALGFALVGPIDLNVVLEFSLAFGASVKGLAALLAVTMTLQQATPVLGQRDRLVTRSWKPNGLDESLFTQVANIA